MTEIWIWEIEEDEERTPTKKKTKTLVTVSRKSPEIEVVAKNPESLQVDAPLSSNTQGL